jgi:hypothetical protein
LALGADKDDGSTGFSGDREAGDDDTDDHVSSGALMVVRKYGLTRSKKGLRANTIYISPSCFYQRALIYISRRGKSYEAM